jgi:hypothetical protein|tara:strand:+ start:141 stop:491 length:351 start_codon:yes stop_codon:yes gene_type:complete
MDMDMDTAWTQHARGMHAACGIHTACTCTCTFQVYIMDTGRMEPGTTTSRAATIMARLGEGVADLASVTAVQGAKRPQGKGIGGPGGSLVCATFTPLGYKPPAQPAPGQARKSVDR